MRLVIDLQGCQNGSRYRGIGRSSLALAKALLRSARDHEVFVFLNGMFADTVEPLQKELGPLMPPGRIVVFEAPGPVDELREENARRNHAAELLREAMLHRLEPDAVFVTSVVEGAQDDTVSSVRTLDGRPLMAALLHDLIPLLDPDRYIGYPPARRWYMAKVDSLRRCDLLLSVSNSAKREAETALGMAPDTVVNISSGADEIFVDAQVEPAQLAACRQRLMLDRPYLMHAGAVEPRKNFQRLVQAFGALPAELRRGYQLVLVGKFDLETRDELQGLARLAGVPAPDLVLTGHVSDEELLALYAGAHLFVYPSLHEGFGLPVLEAMHFGVPVIGSNTTSIPEVIGREDALFDPMSVPAITAKITRCLTDVAFYESLRSHARHQASKFSWDTSAATAWRALEAAVDRLKSAPRLEHNRTAAELAFTSQVVTPPNLPGPTSQEMADIAQAMARNEAECTRLLASARHGGPLRWRIEGPFDSSYSLALVNRESARAFEQLGHEVVLHSTEGPGDIPADPGFLAANPDLAAMHARLARYPHADCDVVSRNLYPPRVADMSSPLNMLHGYAWEETGFPPDWVDDFNRHLRGITCVSEHVRRTLLDNGVTVPMAVVGNGVDHWERVVPAPGAQWPGKRFRFLHVSSCFPRKGADVMLRAFGDAFTSSDDVSLIIKTFANPHNTIGEQVAACRAADPRYPDVQVLEGDYSDSELKSLFLHCHVLVAPSRAEGFGLPLAEGMLSGLPVITTAWGGQLDFCSEDNAWFVDFRYAQTQTHMGLSASTWADPDRKSLADALRLAYAASPQERQQRAEHGRRVLLDHYKWVDVAARSVAAVRAWSREGGMPPPRARVGWITTWNTRCGIASYARHIIEASGETFDVLAPREPGLLREDEPFVRRCWLSAQRESGFEDLREAIVARRLQVLVVQFSLGFFATGPFAEFLHEQVDAGRVVIVMMHATAEPAELARKDPNWRLSTAASALARCHRVLVHSIEDMNRLKGHGVIDNVTLFPHPLWHLPPTRSEARVPSGAGPLLATFGYCLPHKGLPEVIDAVAALRSAGTPVRLLMLNAEYPSPLSSDLARDLRRKIAALDLQGAIELNTDYLEDSEAAALLGRADLLLFAYQDTQESASGAVRHGLATGRPLLVTPVAIFDELGQGVFRAPGCDSASVAEGIAATLASLQAQDPAAVAVDRAAAAWRATHDVHRLARRLSAMAQSLHRLQPPPPVFAFAGASRMLRSFVGRAHGRTLQTTGQEGMLVYGPYVPLAAGRYLLRLHWRATIGPGDQATLAVVEDHARREVTRVRIAAPAAGAATTVELPFVLTRPCCDMEVHLHVTAGVLAEVVAVEILDAADAGDPAPARDDRDAAAAERRAQAAVTLR